MDRALDPDVYSARRDIAPDPALLIRLRAPDPARVEAGAATEGAVTVAGALRLYDEEGPPSTDLPRLAARLARRRDDLPLRTADFGLVIHDAERRTLTLATDAFGSTALYHCRVGGIFVFASWPHLLLALPGISRDLDPVAAAAFIGQVGQPRERTFFSGIRRVAGASTLTRDADGTETVEVRWRAAPAARETSTEDVANAVTTAIRARLAHTRRPLIEVSGGLDSSLVAGLATKLRPDLPYQGLSNVLPDSHSGDESDEREYIEAVLAHNPEIAPGFITSEGADVFAAEMDAWARLAAPPLDSYRFVTMLGLSRHPETDAVIGGFGGDQCLSAGGAPYLYEMLMKGRFGAALGEWRRLRRISGTPPLSLFHFSVFSRLPTFPLWKLAKDGRRVRDTLKPQSDRDVREHLRRHRHRSWVAAERSFRQLESEALEGIEYWMVQEYDDPATGRTRANLRPLLDPRLLEAVLAAPSDLKVSGEHDRALIRAIGGERLPPAVAERRDKTPFSPNYKSLVAARAHEIAADFSRFRRHPLWRDYVDADLAEAALARLTARPSAVSIDEILGQVIQPHGFGRFLERAFPDR